MSYREAPYTLLVRIKRGGIGVGYIRSSSSVITIILDLLLASL